MITLTEKAVAKIKEIAEEDGLDLTIRVAVRGGNCAGFTNELEFCDKILEMDEIMEDGGIKIVVDQMSLQYLGNTTIDYEQSAFISGFRITSENAKGSCGCGKSVAY